MAVALISAQSLVISESVVYCDVTVKRITYLPVKFKQIEFELKNNNCIDEVLNFQMLTIIYKTYM